MQSTNYVINYQKLSQQIITLLRGDLKQRELSELLGYQFNQVGKWESGVTLFSWHDFENLCGKLNIPWRKHIEEALLFHSTDEDKPFPIFTVLSQFLGPLNFEHLSETLHKSRSSLHRLSRNEVKFDFSDVLRLIDLRPFVLQSWLARFLDPMKLEETQAKFKLEAQSFRAILSTPSSAIVNAAIRLDPYNLLPEHSDIWVSAQTGLTVPQVQDAIKVLLDAGGIEYSHATKKYISHFLEMTMLKIPEFRKVTQYLNHFIAEKFQVSGPTRPTMHNPSLSLTRIYPVSAKASREIADALVEFHHRVGKILQQDNEPKDHVRTILIHCLDLSLFAEKQPQPSSSAPGLTQPL